MCPTIIRIDIRNALETDAPALCAIYAPYVRDTIITFETKVPSDAEFAERIREYSRTFPFLVARAWFDDGTKAVCGYAYGSPQGARAAYRWNVQYSVYIAEYARGKGIAAKLYYALEELLKLQGYKNAYAIITSPNPQSERFHKKWGFTPLALHPKTGYKHDKWIDVLWMSKQLSAHNTPTDVIPPHLLPPQEIARIFDEAIKPKL